MFGINNLDINISADTPNETMTDKKNSEFDRKTEVSVLIGKDKDKKKLSK